jgi:hypothetical protein
MCDAFSILKDETRTLSKQEHFRSLIPSGVHHETHVGSDREQLCVKNDGITRILNQDADWTARQRWTFSLSEL